MKNRVDFFEIHAILQLNHTKQLGKLGNKNDASKKCKETTKHKEVTRLHRNSKAAAKQEIKKRNIAAE